MLAGAAVAEVSAQNQPIAHDEELRLSDKINKRLPLSAKKKVELGPWGGLPRDGGIGAMDLMDSLQLSVHDARRE